MRIMATSCRTPRTGSRSNTYSIARAHNRGRTQRGRLQDAVPARQKTTESNGKQRKTTKNHGKQRKATYIYIYCFSYCYFLGASWLIAPPPRRIQGGCLDVGLQHTVWPWNPVKHAENKVNASNTSWNIAEDAVHSMDVKICGEVHDTKGLLTPVKFKLPAARPNLSDV